MERKPVLNGVIGAPLAATAPDGKAYLLYLRDDSLMAQQFDNAAGAVRGVRSFWWTGSVALACLQCGPTIRVSADGVLALQTAPDPEKGLLAWVNRSGDRLTRLPSVEARVPLAACLRTGGT